jgi:hypothetical protein
MLNFTLIKSYITRLNLENLNEISSYKFNSRCPVCGDSKTKKSKKRFYILFDGEKCTCVCHNCGLNMSFFNLLKNYYNSLYDDFQKEMFFSNVKYKRNKTVEINKPVKKNKIAKKYDVVKDFIHIKENKEALDYCQKRKLPEKYIDKLYYCNNYIKWLHDNKYSKFEYIPSQDKRIIIPFIQNKELTHLQARSIQNDSSLRYLSATINEDYVKVFNYDNINTNEDVYIIEGPFDCMFVDNCISFGTANININFFDNIKTNKIVIFDTDIRKNDELKKIAWKYIDYGFGISIWPKNYSVYKDVNEMILNNISQVEINNTIKNNVHYGLRAKVGVKLLK